MSAATSFFDRRGRLTNGLCVQFMRLREPIAEFVYQGRDERGTLHLWQEDGRWRCEPHATPHPFDLRLNDSK